MSALERALGALHLGKVVRVGVMGASDGRDSGGSNATVGLVQEFGSVSKKIPIRSFIRMPIEEKRDEIKERIGKEVGAVMQGKYGAKKALKRIGIEAEGVISDAFETGGFGKWAANAPSTIRQKGSAQPLIGKDVELSKSITSKVVD
jgi:hypothetical protein